MACSQADQRVAARKDGDEKDKERDGEKGNKIE
jgi:hypothetical protein